MVILGGSGSQPGVVLGAIIISVLLELLRDPGKSRLVFVAALLGGLVLAFRFSKKLALVAAAEIIFGFALHELARAHSAAWVAGEKGGGFARRARALGRRPRASRPLGRARLVHRPDRRRSSS